MTELSDADVFGASSTPKEMSDADVFGKNGVMDNLSSNFNKNLANEAPNIAKSNPVQSLLELAGNVGAKSVYDTAGDEIKKIPGYDTAAQAIKPYTSSAMQTMGSGAQSIADLIDKTGVGQATGDYLMNHPEQTATARAVGNLMLLEGILGKAADIASPVVDNFVGTAKALKNAPWDIPEEPQPYDMPAKPSSPRNLQAVTDANQTLADNTNALYKKANDLGFSFTQPGGQWLSDTVRNSVEDATGGLDKQNHPSTIAALNTLDNKAGDGLTLTGFDKVRQTLGRIAQNANPDKANDVYAANKARRAMDDVISQTRNDPTLATGNSDALDALDAARVSHSLEMQHSDLRTIIRNANGNGNKIQSEFQKMYKDEDGFNNLLPENQSIVQSVAQSNLAMSAAKGIGNLGFGSGGNKWALGSEGLAALLHPASAAVVTPAVAAGTMANVVRNKIIRKAADQALKNIENASETMFPLYGESKFSPLEVGPKALPSPEIPLALTEKRPMIGGRGKTPRPATDEEWQDIIDKEKNETTLGLDKGTRKAQQTAKISQYERDNPANNFFNKVGDVPMRSSQTALDPRTTGVSPEIFDEKTGYKSGGRVNTNPSEKQIAAGNYSKGHIKLYGLDITIENPKGSIRRGIDKGGKKWQVKMPADYGYIRGTVGADKEHIDCYIGPRPKSEKTWVIDQKHADTGKFDEHKIFIGFLTKGHVLSAYHRAFSDGKADQRIQNISECSIEELKKWLDKTRRDVA